MIQKKNRKEILDIIQYFSNRSLKHYSLEKVNLFPYLKPYKFKDKYIRELYHYYEKSSLPKEIKEIILDQYSFLKEHSNVLMSTKRFANHLRRTGTVILDATNRFYDKKFNFIGESRGLRWLFGFIISAAGISKLTENPILGSILGLSGAILVLIDP